MLCIVIYDVCLVCIIITIHYIMCVRRTLYVHCKSIHLHFYCSKYLYLRYTCACEVCELHVLTYAIAV